MVDCETGRKFQVSARMDRKVANVVIAGLKIGQKAEHCALTVVPFLRSLDATRRLVCARPLQLRQQH
jgi:hypothetical protein